MRTVRDPLLGNMGEFVGLVDLFGHGGFTIEKDGTVTIENGGYDYRWLRIPRANEGTPV
ncbi:hypothetical protein [Chelativorans sp. M5D2P16]|uniref:hypothetical protein n=1 Tax=Chelativorans sp. M5D2P16 TaxID=3095678 RepID=UPI002ACA9C1E|nr:hypothetical protein [Chelativorans sp. M5D2P16]MDZ5697892.1 hypothetical protein [Chelativorans sp. M5D2P16]